MTATHRIEGFNCAKCGAPMENPYTCTHCGARYRQRDDDPEFRKTHPNPFDFESKVYLGIITAIIFPLSVLILFFGSYLPGWVRITVLFAGLPVLVAAIAAFLATDFIPVSHEGPEREKVAGAFTGWLMAKRPWWCLLKPIAVVVPLYLVGATRPALYGLAGFLPGFALAALVYYWLS